MTRIYELAAERWVVICARGRQLILQYKEGERTDRPFLLVQDYADGFSGVVYQNTVYYTYRNEQGDWQLKNVRDSVVYYRVPTKGAADLLKATVWRGSLVLLHIGTAPNATGVFLECIQMFEGPAQMLIEALPDGENVRLISHPAGGMVVACADQRTNAQERGTGTENAVYYVDSNGNVYKMEIDERKAQDQGYDEKLRELQEELKRKEAETDRLKQMLSSASSQYRDLMHVAEQYREEAIKWRSKLTF